MSGDPTGSMLRGYVERIERLCEERRGISDDIRDVYAEAKAMGFDGKTLRRLIARRAMAPGDRAEADALLETYEAALGGEAVAVPDVRPDAAALALALLTEQIAGIEDPEQAAQLVEHVTFLLDLRAEIAGLREQEKDRKKLAKAEGFDTNQMAVTVRWYEKCARHGVEAMRAGEEVFHLYRSTVDGQRASGGPVSGDPKLQSMFAPKAEKPNRRAHAAEVAAAMARAAKQAGDEG